MRPTTVRLAIPLALVAALAAALTAVAQQPGVIYVPAPAPGYSAAPAYPAAVVCPQCGQVHAPGSYDVRTGAALGARSAGRGGPEVNPYVGPNQLPRGRVYYNGRFFGGFNNRFYGPQYGYF